MRFLAVIPARYASTRFPGKPLAIIAGKTMIERVWLRATQVFEYCCVATDDTRIYDAVTAFGGKAVMTSTDHRSGTDRCYEALQKAGANDFDVVVNIQGDEPFIAIEQLLQIKECFVAADTDIATLIKPFTAHEDIFNPNAVKAVVSQQGFALYFSRSAIPYLRGVEPEQWQNEHCYYKHIGLYAYRTHVLEQITALPADVLEVAESLEQLRWLGNGYRIKCAVTTQPSYGIDTPEDLAALDLSKLALSSEK